jgi:uncharacterized protein YprB with RNaseH-like and TPR domain
VPPNADVAPLYGLDIETDTACGGLDPSRAAIVAVAVSTAEVDVVFDGPEPSLLAELDAHLASLPPGVIVTWNGATFDLPFLAARAGVVGVPLGLRLLADPGIRIREPQPGLERGYRAAWHDHGHLDGYRLYRADVGRTLPVSCGLKPMARMLGLAPVEVDVAQLHLLPAHEVAAYVASDARMARLLVDRRWPVAVASVDCLTPSAH